MRSGSVRVARVGGVGVDPPPPIVAWNASVVGLGRGNRTAAGRETAKGKENARFHLSSAWGGRCAGAFQRRFVAVDQTGSTLYGIHPGAHDADFLPPCFPSTPPRFRSTTSTEAREACVVVRDVLVSLTRPPAIRIALIAEKHSADLGLDLLADSSHPRSCRRFLTADGRSGAARGSLKLRYSPHP